RTAGSTTEPRGLLQELAEQDRAASAEFLGLVQRGVGVADEHVDRDAATAADRDADAGPDRGGPPAHRHRFGERVDQSVGELAHLALTGRVLAQHHELVTAEAGDDVTATQ